MTLIAFLLALLLAEAVLRFYFPPLLGFQIERDSRLGLVPKPHAIGKVISPWLYSYRFSHDSSGLRSTEGKEKNRLLMLGDSMVYGVGVNDEETFSSMLGADNAGAPGRGPDYYLGFIENRLPLLRPNKVWIFFTAYNDWLDSYRASHHEDILFFDSSRLLVLSEKTFRFAWGRIRQYQASNASLPNPGDELYQAGKSYLCKINEALSMKEIDHKFFFLPGPEEMKIFRRGEKPGTWTAFERAAQECDFKPEGLASVFMDGELSEYFNLRDFHLTARGNALIAKALEAQK